MRHLSTTLLIALAAWAGAQPLAGTYQGATDVGTAVVALVQSGDALTGTLEAPGVSFAFEGQVADGIGFGLVQTADGTAGFEAHVRGDVLGLYLFERDAAGEAVDGTVIELLLERVAAAAAPSAPALGGLRAPPEGTSSGTPAAPASRPAPAPPAAAPGSRVLAVGAHATLTEDAALAFLEALEFVLAQIGVPYVLPEAERRAALDELARAFPEAEAHDQLVLADARAIWQRVQANWASSSPDAQREFAIGVLALAFGDETVEAWLGANAGGGGGAPGAGGTDDCASFDDCASAYVDDQTWSDTFDTQSCWAAAGCSSFDTSTGTFEYE